MQTNNWSNSSSTERVNVLRTNSNEDQILIFKKKSTLSNKFVQNAIFSLQQVSKQNLWIPVHVTTVRNCYCRGSADTSRTCDLCFFCSPNSIQLSSSSIVCRKSLRHILLENHHSLAGGFQYKFLIRSITFSISVIFFRNKFRIDI